MPVDNRLEPGAHEVVLVRHGETEWSRSGRTPANGPGPHRRRRAAAPSLRLARDVRARAREPDAPIAGNRSPPGSMPRRYGRLREWDYGEYEGRTTAAIRRDVPDWTVFTHPVPAANDRRGRGTRRSGHHRGARSGDVLIFGHGHALRVLGARWCDFPPLYARNLALQPASVSVLSYERETPVLGQWDWLPDLA
jgi:probable phosphoglycerate mutase